VSEIHFHPSATIDRFMASDAFVRCIVGPVGSGKSSAAIVEIPVRAKAQAPGPDGIRRSRWAVIRNTYPQLRDTTRKTFEQWISANYGKWHEQEFTFEMRFEDVHAEVLFRALDRPEDVKKVLSLEITGAYINEAREIPKHVFDVLQTRVGRYPSKIQGGATWFGIWMDTNPWATTHWGYELFSKDKPAEHELFEQPDGLSPDAENVENLPAGYYNRLCLGKDAEWVNEYVRSMYPTADRGSVYGQLIEALERRGNVCEFDHPNDGVFCSLDLGWSDATSIWFWRIGKDRMPDVIDWYENAGQPLSHYFNVIEERGYRIQKIWLPHDARAHSLQTGASTVEQFAKRFGAGAVAIGPELSIEDGIAAGRWLLEQPMRFHERCAEGLKRLRSYRYQWDEAKKVFTKKPLHDWSSNTADGFRYLACVAQHTERLTRPPEPKPAPKVKSIDQFTLDELYAQRRTPAGPRRI
jgi:hypothetical protein